MQAVSVGQAQFFSEEEGSQAVRREPVRGSSFRKTGQMRVNAQNSDICTEIVHFIEVRERVDYVQTELAVEPVEC